MAISEAPCATLSHEADVRSSTAIPVATLLLSVALATQVSRLVSRSASDSADRLNGTRIATLTPGAALSNVPIDFQQSDAERPEASLGLLDFSGDKCRLVVMYAHSCSVSHSAAASWRGVDEIVQGSFHLPVLWIAAQTTIDDAAHFTREYDLPSPRIGARLTETSRTQMGIANWPTFLLIDAAGKLVSELPGSLARVRDSTKVPLRSLCTVSLVDP